MKKNYSTDQTSLTTTLYDPNNNISIDLDTPNQISNYRKELVIAKVIISEYKDKFESEKSKNIKLEDELKKSLETIKNLHKDYCNLTDKVNQSFAENEDVNSLKQLLAQKESELKEKNEIYKIKILQLNNQIASLNQKLNQIEKNFETETNVNQMVSKNAHNKLLEENKQLKLQIEKLKCNISLLESEKKNCDEELKTKETDLMKQRLLAEKFKKLNENLAMSLKEKNKSFEALTDKFNVLLEENKNNKERLIKLQNEKGYIENMLLKYHPDSEMIKQIMELNEEIFYLEKQRKKIELIGNENSRIKATRIFQQIESLKEQIARFENKIYLDTQRQNTSELLLSQSSSN